MQIRFISVKLEGWGGKWEGDGDLVEFEAQWVNRSGGVSSMNAPLLVKGCVYDWGWRRKMKGREVWVLLRGFNAPMADEHVYSPWNIRFLLKCLLFHSVVFGDIRREIWLSNCNDLTVRLTFLSNPLRNRQKAKGKKPRRPLYLFVLFIFNSFKHILFRNV